MKEDYEDIIDLPHPVSGQHPPMSMEKRAAQFAPFAALTGYDSLITHEVQAIEHQDSDSGSKS